MLLQATHSPPNRCRGLCFPFYSFNHALFGSSSPDRMYTHSSDRRETWLSHSSCSPARAVDPYFQMENAGNARVGRTTMCLVGNYLGCNTINVPKLSGSERYRGGGERGNKSNPHNSWPYVHCTDSQMLASGSDCSIASRGVNMLWSTFIFNLYTALSNSQRITYICIIML